MTTPTTSHRLSSTLALLGLAGLAAAAVLALGTRIVAVLSSTAAAPALAPVERWVELVVLAVGATAAAWMLLGCLVALGCTLLVRGRRAGEHLDTVLGRWAPAVVTRLARGAVGVGLGAGLALAPVAATAADVAPGPSTTTVLDLGWQPTQESPTPTPAADAHRSVPVQTATPAPSVPGPAGAGGSADPSTPGPAATPSQVMTPDPVTTPGPVATPRPAATAGAEVSAPDAASPDVDAVDRRPAASPAGTPALDDVVPDTAPAHPDHRAAGAEPRTATEQGLPGRADAGRDTEDGTSGRGRSPRPVTHGDAEVVVVRGDTLWDIAARHLEPDAGDGDVLREMLRWHDANREVIGDDPDLVLPGQVLRSP